MTIFSSGIFRGRTSDAYLSILEDFKQETVAVFKLVTQDDPFFRSG